MKNKTIHSVVVPVFNEASNASALFDEIKTHIQKLTGSYEIIFVDDGSSDSTAEELLKKTPITLIQLRRNAGQSAALDAGIKQASGEIIISMDGDVQDDPSYIPVLL